MASSPEVGILRIRTLFRFLIGGRRAIAEIASDKRAVWIGLLFVISAGLARDYDGAYLLAEPWHVVMPLCASLAASLLLYALLYRTLVRRMANRPRFWSGFRVFVSLFWMTAPLAWLYAIPYERFLGSYEAALANLSTLGVVSIWRVLLITRVVSVLMNVRIWTAFFPVMLFADVVALVGVMASPVPIVRIMGGLRYSPADELLQGVMSWVSCLGIPTLLVWLIATRIATSRCMPAWCGTHDVSVRQTGHGSATVLAIGSVLGWFFILPFTQPEQRLRRTVDSHFKQGRIREALGVMSQVPRGAFPPDFDPRPRNRAGQTTPSIWDVIEVVASTDQANWVRVIYVEKLRLELDSRWYANLGGRELAQLVGAVERLPEGPQLAAGLRKDIRDWMLRTDDKQSRDYGNLVRLLNIADSGK